MFRTLVFGAKLVRAHHSVPPPALVTEVGVRFSQAIIFHVRELVVSNVVLWKTNASHVCSADLDYVLSTVKGD